MTTQLSRPAALLFGSKPRIIACLAVLAFLGLILPAILGENTAAAMAAKMVSLPLMLYMTYVVIFEKGRRS